MAMKMITQFASIGLFVLISAPSPLSAFQQDFQRARTKTTQLSSTQNAVFFKKIDVYEGARRDVSGMQDWAVNNGVQQADGVQLTDTTSMQDMDGVLDVGVMTNVDLPAGSPVILTPNHLVLSALKAQQEFGQITGAEELLWRINEGDQLPQFYLMVKILKEYELGSESPFYQYLNSLPRCFASGACMTHFCCSRCLPPYVGKLSNKERVRFSKFFQALKHAKFLSESSARDRRVAKWAFAIAYTRSVPTYDGDVKIAPMCDMFNHGTEYEVELNFDEEGNCCAYTTKDVPAGSQLRMSYGDPTNPSYLFARYGFLDETSPATFCKIMIDDPSPELVNMGYDHSRMLFYKDTGGVSQEVWDVLLYQILGQYNPQLQQQFYQAHMNGDNDTKQAFHQEYYPQTSQALLQHIDGFLNQLGVLMETASARMNGKKSWKHPRLPLIMRHNEFVRNTFLKVREQL